METMPLCCMVNGTGDGCTFCNAQFLVCAEHTGSSYEKGFHPHFNKDGLCRKRFITQDKKGESK